MFYLVYCLQFFTIIARQFPEFFTGCYFLGNLPLDIWYIFQFPPSILICCLTFPSLFAENVSERQLYFFCKHSRNTTESRCFDVENILPIELSWDLQPTYQEQLLTVRPSFSICPLTIPMFNYSANNTPIKLHCVLYGYEYSF